jgi:hypothetical protein
MGLVITNNHVIEEANLGTAFGQITVESFHSVDHPASDALPAEVVIRNEDIDLAVLRIAGTAPLHFIDLVTAPPIGADLIERRIRVLGYPLFGGPTITVTRGIVSGFDAGNLKTDAEVNPGNSGGAALDDLDTFLGIPSFSRGGPEGKLGLIISADRIRQWFEVVLKSGVPNTAEDLETAFDNTDLNFSDGNLDRSARYPRILGEFAAVETLLASGEFEKAVPHAEFILDKRPRSALAHHYYGQALLGLGRYLEAADAFRASLAYDRSHVPALGNLGLTLIRLERHSEALRIFEEIIATRATTLSGFGRPITTSDRSISIGGRLPLQRCITAGRAKSRQQEKSVSRTAAVLGILGIW